MKRKFIGSTIAMIIGILSFLGSIAQISSGNPQPSPLAGEVMILGSLAYRSLKKRRLVLVESTKLRQLFEIIALVLIVALVVLQKDFKIQLAYHPVPNFIIPVWSLIAYGIIFFKKPSSEFTLEQLKLMQELTNKEIERIKARKQEIIDEGAKRDEVILTDKLLKSLDELKSSYSGDNPEEYFAMIDKMKKDFREKYGPTIPVDVAYKISEGLEDLP